MFSNKNNVNILTALLADYGVRHIVTCPGSRNAPLINNFNECGAFECHPVTDERSAAFVALGLRIATGEMTAVCVTSGSALLNTLPAVAEASYQRHGIIVVSADRPAEWIDQLDGQTIPQPGALGRFVASSVSLPECGEVTAGSAARGRGKKNAAQEPDSHWHCRRLVCEALIALLTTKRSVHINVPIAEPLFNFSLPTLPEQKRVHPLAWDDDFDQSAFLSLLSRAKRPMFVIGQATRGAVPDDVLYTLRQAIVVLAEPLSADDPSPSLDKALSLLSAAAGSPATSLASSSAAPSPALSPACKPAANQPQASELPVLGGSVAEYQPDFVLYLGGNTVSKRLRQFLRSLPASTTVVIQSADYSLADPSCRARYLLQGDMTRILGEISTMVRPRKLKFNDLWADLLRQARDASKQSAPTLEARAVQLFEERRSSDDNVFYANSTAVRLAAAYARHFVYCNRGVNGIEGSLSTAVGASLATDDMVFCVIGDLSFFYDQNALWNTQLRPNLRILLLNNGGGAIFSSLAGLEASSALPLIAARHHATAQGACQQFDLQYRAVSTEAEITDALMWLEAPRSSRPRILEIISNNDNNKK